MSDIEDESPTDVGVNMKRKSPFVDSGRDRVNIPETPEQSIDHKHARTNTEIIGLPDLLENECELLVDLEALASQLNEADISVSRLEIESPLAKCGTMQYRLVVFLTRYEVAEEETSSKYDLGLYLRVIPPAGKEGQDWTYRGVSFILMLINAKNPFSGESVVHTDTCSFTRRDECRGWTSSLSFDSLEDIEKSGFLLSDGKSVLCRGQAVYEGGSEPCTDVIQEHKYRGLENQGATCYLNGLLQSLFHIGKLREIIYSVSNEEDGSNIVTALQRVFYDLEANPYNTPSASSEPLTEAFGWSRAEVGLQQDMQEMTRLLIDKLESRLKNSGKDKMLKNLFCGKVENYIKCTDIEYKSVREEEFYDIQLNVIRGMDCSSQIESIEEALDEILAVEILEGQNAYDAGESRGKQRAEKGVCFVELPPILTFQLMRFQFDFESMEMQKLNSKFAFGKSLDMTPYCPSDPTAKYQLYAVLVHSGGVHGGHYYAFIRPENSWYRFDDTLVERVDPDTAIIRNFGGPALSDKIQNYLFTSTTREKPRHFSAYMLMYVRESEAVDLLKSVTLEQVNPPLIPSLTAAPVRPETPKFVPVKFLDTAKCFTHPLKSIHDIPSEWIQEVFMLKPTDPLSSLFENADESMCVAVMESVSRFREVDIKSDLSALNLCNQLGVDQLVVIVSSIETKLCDDDILLVRIEFESDELRFGGIEFQRPNHALQGRSLWALSPDGFSVEEIESEDQIQNGMVVITIPSKSDGESLTDYFERFRFTGDLTIVVHPLDRPWNLGGAPGLSVDGDRDVEMSDVDLRRKLKELEPEGKRALFFREDPLLVDVPACDPEIRILDALNSETYSMHCVFIPRPPEMAGSIARWDQPRPLMVRLFNENVSEVDCDVVYISSGETIGDLIAMAKDLFGLPSDGKRYRLLEVDVYDCEISKVYLEDEKALVSTLLTWGASNIFMHSVRLEADDSKAFSLKLKSFHLNWRNRTPFGHPILLCFDDPGDMDNQESLEGHLSHKLHVPIETVRAWSLSVIDGSLVIKHAVNPFIQQSSPTREKALFIKD